MAGAKTVKNAGEAAAKAAQAADDGAFTLPKGAQERVAMATRMGIDAKSLTSLYESFIPELKAGGYTSSQIKKILKEKDPHLAAKNLLEKDKNEVKQQILAANAGYTPESLAKSNLRDLWTTYEEVSKPGAERPSNIRNQDTSAKPVTESRVPNTPATPAPAMAETPKAEAPQGNRQARRKAAAEAEALAAQKNAEAARGGNWESVEWGRSGKNVGQLAREAKGGDFKNFTEKDFKGESFQTGDGAYQESTVQPPKTDGGGQVDAGGKVEVAKEEAKKTPVLSKDPIANAARGAGPWLKRQFTEKPLVAYPAAAIGVPTAMIAANRLAGPVYEGAKWLYSEAFGLNDDQTPAAGQQPRGGQQGQAGPRINVLSREDLRRLESPQAPQPPMQQPMQQPAPVAPAQPPMQAPPPQPPSRAGQTTDIIRQLSGRMV